MNVFRERAHSNNGGFIMAEFGERLREFRQQKGVTQQTVAENIFVTRQAISQWESGARYPDLLTAKKLAEYLDVPLDCLLSENELTEYSERSPIIESAQMIGLHASAYTALAVLYFINGVISLASLRHLAERVLSVNASTSAVMGNAVAYTVLVLILSGISVYGTILAVQERITPKIAGWLSVTYFGLHIIMRVCTGIMISSGIAATIAFCLVPAIGIFCSFSYFGTSRNSHPTPVIIICALYILESVIALMAGTDILLSLDEAEAFATILAGLCNVLTMCIIIWQVHVLASKRKITANQEVTMEKSNRSKKAVLICVGILAIAILCGIGYRTYNVNTRYKQEVSSFIKENQTDLEAIAQKYLRHEETDAGQEYKGKPILGLFGGEHPIVYFHYTSSGMIGRGKEYDFFYSPDNVPVSISVSSHDLNQVSNDTWTWEDAESGTSGKIVRIAEKWYYIETEF